MNKSINVHVFIHTSFKHIQTVSRRLKLYIKSIWKYLLPFFQFSLVLLIIVLIPAEKVGSTNLH